MVIKPSTWKGILALTSICTVLLGGVNPAGSSTPVLVAQQATSRTPQTLTGRLDQNSTVLEDDASQYKDYVLTLLFMKYVSDKYANDPYGMIVVPDGGSFKDMVALKGD